MSAGIIRPKREHRVVELSCREFLVDAGKMKNHCWADGAIR